jgi:hypothetical protein
MNSDNGRGPTRREMLLSGSSLLGLSLLGTSYAAALPEPIQMAQAQGQAAAKPNIVVVLMDNLGYGELGVYGGGILRGAPTPRIDALAADGMHLLNFNVEAQCTPSRAALLTGRYAVRTGNGSVPLDTPVYGLEQWEVTLPEVLSNAGYATGAFGKWHLGHTPGRYPTDQGFDEWYGIPNSTDEAYWADDPLFRPNSDSFAVAEQVMEGKKGEAPKGLKVYNLAERRIIDREITDKAKDFMSRQVAAGKPFFAYIPYTMVHMPVLPAPELTAKRGTVSGPTLLRRSTPTLVNCWIRWISLVSGTTRSSSLRPTTAQRCSSPGTDGAAHGAAAISPGSKAHCGSRSLSAGPAKSPPAASAMKSSMRWTSSRP